MNLFKKSLFGVSLLFLFVLSLTLIPTNKVDAIAKPVVTVTASPLTVNYGGSSTIKWTSSNATSCSMVRSDTGEEISVSLSGSYNTGSLTKNTYFTVSCDSGSVASSCPSYYAHCFIADTVVTMSDGTKKNIQDVKVGDILKGEKTNNTVLGLDRPELSGDKLYSFNKGRYFVTAEHPFKTINGWKSINPKKTENENIGITVTTLKVGDTLVTDKGNVLIKTIDSKVDGYNTNLFNFFLDGDHTYYADGYLVHNKLACRDGQTPNIAGGCEICPAFNLPCASGYTSSCTGGATLCTKSSCAGGTGGDGECTPFCADPSGDPTTASSKYTKKISCTNAGYIWLVCALK
jgi:hypothetical protein